MADNSRGVRSMADPLVKKGIQELIEVIFFRKIGNVPNLCNRTPLMIEVIGHTQASGAVQSPITVGMFPMLA